MRKGHCLPVLVITVFLMIFVAPISTGASGLLASAGPGLHPATVGGSPNELVGLSAPLTINPTYAWHTFYGSSGDNEGGASVAVDSSGNTYITGSSNGTWNGPAGQPPLHAHSGGRTDIFVLKLNSSGAYQWHTFYGDGGGSVGGSQGTGIALDDSGNVYVTGQSSGSWVGPSGETPLHAYDGYGGDVIVLKLDTNGAYQWHTFYGGGSNEIGYGIAVGDGNVYVTGPASNTMTGPAGQPPLHPYAGGHVPFVVLKLDSSGAYQWHTFYGSDYSYSHAIATDGSGNVYVTGDSDGPWNGPSGETPLNPWAGTCCWNAWRDIFVLKLDTNGAYQWHTFYASASNDNVGFGIAVDGSDNVYVTGQSFVPWNGSSGESPLNPFGTSGAYYDLFALKLNSGGVYQWHTFYGGGAGANSGNGIAVDSSGNVYVTGHTDSFDHWNGPSGQTPLYTYSGGIVVLKLDSSGAYQWHTFYGQNGGDGGGGIAVDSRRNVYITGSSFPGWNGPAGQLPLNPYNNAWDIVVLKMAASSLDAIQSLIVKYYNDVLGRAPDPGGAGMWASEIERIVSLGIDTREGFQALAKFFFNSDEYYLQNKTDGQFVTDLYQTFLNRAPDPDGFDFWVNYLGQGLTKNMLITQFAYSDEFKLYIEGIFGAGTTRPEDNLVNDLYRGFLNRFPDTGGFNGWVALMRNAQCTGAQAVKDLTSQIALGFVQSQEYGLRNRSNQGYVEDLYNGILRRGADPGGFVDWVTQLNSGTYTREQMLPLFTSSAEFQFRVTDVINAGCIP